MASKKAGGTAKNLTDSKPKFLGVKLFAGQRAMPGQVLVRQRGTRMLPGNSVAIGKDHTLFSLIEGIVTFRTVRKTRYDGKTVIKSAVDVVESQ